MELSVSESETPTIPTDSMQHIDNVLAASKLHWDVYALGIRRIYFLCRTRGYNPNSARGIIEYMGSILGKETVVTGQPTFEVMSWVWYNPEESWLLIVSTKGVEFRVPVGLEPDAAMDIWKTFHGRFQEPRSTG